MGVRGQHHGDAVGRGIGGRNTDALSLSGAERWERAETFPKPTRVLNLGARKERPLCDEYDLLEQAAQTLKYAGTPEEVLRAFQQAVVECAPETTVRILAPGLPCEISHDRCRKQLSATVGGSMADKLPVLGEAQHWESRDESACLPGAKVFLAHMVKKFRACEAEKERQEHR